MPLPKVTAKSFTSTKDHNLNSEEGGRYKLYECSISCLLGWISCVLSKYGSYINNFVGLPSRNTRVNHHMSKGSCSASSDKPPTSHHGDIGSISDPVCMRFMLDKVVLRYVFSQYFGLTLSVEFHQFSVFIYLFISHQ